MDSGQTGGITCVRNLIPELPDKGTPAQILSISGNKKLEDLRKMSK